MILPENLVRESHSANKCQAQNSCIGSHLPCWLLQYGYLLHHVRKERQLDSNAVVVYITAPSLEVAEQIAKALVSERLAACVNLIPGIRSIYKWKDQVQSSVETLLVVKTRASLVETRLVPFVETIHPYDLPEVIAVPVEMGSPVYLDWIKAETEIC